MQGEKVGVRGRIWYKSDGGLVIAVGRKEGERREGVVEEKYWRREERRKKEEEVWGAREGRIQ